MMSIRKFLLTWGAIAGFLHLLLAGTIAIAKERPPFDDISVKGGVQSGAPKEPDATYLRFQAKLKFNEEEGEAIAALCGQQECTLPDVTINTKLYLPFLMQILHLNVAGKCFMDTKQGYRFKMPPDDPQNCVTAMLAVETDYPEVDLFDGVSLDGKDLKELLMEFEIKVHAARIGNQPGRPLVNNNNTLWGDYFFVDTSAKFMNPSFAYPVAGFGGAEGPSSGNEICIGGRCGFAPFGDIGFKGRAGKKNL